MFSSRIPGLSYSGESEKNDDREKTIHDFKFECKVLMLHA